MDPVTISAAVALTILGIAASVGGAWAVINFRVPELEKRVNEIEARAEADARDLASFKLEAAGKFVTDAMLQRVEERVVSAINRLGDRMDKIIQNSSHN